MIEHYEKHPAISHASELKNLCDPLASLDITTFSHLRILKNNQLTVLCNHPQFLLNYLEKKHYAADPCVSVKPELVDIGEYVIWDSVDCGGSTAKMLEDSASFDFKHVFTIIKKQESFTDFYHFGTHLTNSMINQVYINNLDVLDRFISYFNNHVQQSRLLANAYNIILNKEQNSSDVDLSQNSTLFADIKYKRNKLLHILNPADTKKLTLNEEICARLVLEGKTNKEIATCLGLSHRTIEDRIDALKRKTNSKNKTELVIKLIAHKSA